MSRFSGFPYRVTCKQIFMAYGLYGLGMNRENAFGAFLQRTFGDSFPRFQMVFFRKLQATGSKLRLKPDYTGINGQLIR